ncbi:peptidase M1-like protein [Micromonospora kangleipakensis]|uniref:Aminopeptidase N n=1 Tax=Micromonospora kangleipakensis TaxID=1077942 RepID=A0A4Q8B9K3_9ACTN|nr:M1 family metallopeptidase [Micromonospora kangleipakensis]RZU73619.1 peptidase M1-like protein [Micromonospora kangleipakensis]
MRTLRTRLSTTLAAGLTMALLTGATASADPGGGGHFRPGAPGVGDPYFPTYGNGGYDVAHYDLAIRYNPATDLLDGHAVIRATATQNLSSFNLDLVGLTVDAITVDGKRARWSRSGQELTVTPQRKLHASRPFTVDVRYHGVPQPFTLPGTDIETGWMHTDDGAVVAGQPEVAAAWYPVNDHPLDKASYTFAITVPAGLAAISNGIHLGTTTRNGWSTWRWQQTTPMISYLATATIGRFRISETTHNGKPMVIAVDPDLPPGLADDAVGRTGEITDFLATQFGPYPFEANGAIVDDYDNLFFALENQTRTIYSKYFFAPGVNTWETYVVAHELAHQWYGDSVAVHFWRDIWLNEGFATYAEWLWSDRLGEGTPKEIFDFLYAQPLDAGYWSPPPGEPGVNDLFGGSVYVRGAMTLQALRMTVGDSAFWTIMRTWAASKRGGNGSTPEFIALAERISGEQLDALFDAWLFQGGKPPYPGSSVLAAKRAEASTKVPPAVRALQERLAIGNR